MQSRRLRRGCARVLAGCLGLTSVCAPSSRASGQTAAADGDAALTRKRREARAPAALAVETAALPAVGDRLCYAFFADAVYTVNVTRVRAVFANARLVEGTVAGECSAAFHAVVSDDGARHEVHDFSRGRLYQQVTLPDGSVEVREYDDAKRPPVSDIAAAGPALPAEETLAASAPVPQEGTLETIDIMIGFDAAAKNWADDNEGGMTALAVAALAKLNRALENSGIAARLRLVHIFACSGTHTNALAGELAALKTGAGDFAPVGYYRRQTGADLVGFFVDTGSAYGLVGVADTPGSATGDVSAAYSVCAVRSVGISQTLAHEIGHNLGAGHSKAQRDDPGPSALADDAAGWYFTAADELNYHTIMAYNDDGDNRYFPCDHFSTPLVTWQGVPVGDAQNGNNARIMNVLKGGVAAYRPSVATVTVTFDPCGGTLVASNATFTVGEPYGELPAPVREGYIFLGWCSAYGEVSAETIASPLYTGLSATWGALPATDYTYILSGAGASIIAYNGKAGEVDVPGTLGGEPVTTIGESAFRDNASLVRVTLPDTVTAIGNHAFIDATNLAEIHLPTGLVSIGSALFQSCASLTNLAFPPGISSVPDRTCYQCTRLAEVTIPEGVTNIGANAFVECGRLVRVDLPSTLTGIGENAFQFCGSLTNAVISSGVRNIPVGAFQNCGSLRRATLPAGLKSIGSFAFYCCSNLTGVTLPASVENIGVSAFLMCQSITELVIPAAATNVACDAFAGCSRLPAIQVATGNPAYRSQDGMLYDKTGLTLIACPAGRTGSVAIPAGVVSIGDGAFLSCTGLVSVAIPEGVTSIGNSTFQYCTGLTTLVVPASVTHVGGTAFRCCFHLTGILFKGAAPGIGARIFENDNRLAIYHPPGASGWEAIFGGLPVETWRPRIMPLAGAGWVREGAFTFGIEGSAGFPVVVEACADPAAGEWGELARTNAPSASAPLDFSDAGWAAHAVRFYRLRAP